MTLKLFGENETKARELLGDKEPTPEALATLLEELAARRSAPSPPDPAPVANDTTALLRTVEHLTAKVEELAKAKDPDAVDRAIGEGRVPALIGIAPQLGYAGLGPGGTGLPRGEWFTPTFGPLRIPTMLCGCGRCSGHREYHFYCVVCKSGPHEITTAKPIFKRANMGPGDTTGISYFACAGPCAIQLMQNLGQTMATVPAPTMPMERPPVTSLTPEPSRPMIPAGSD